MPAVRYILWRDDGQVFGIADTPTKEDLDHAKHGLVTILRISDLHYFGRVGIWVELPPGKVVTPDMEGTASEPFHVRAT